MGCLRAVRHKQGQHWQAQRPQSKQPLIENADALELIEGQEDCEYLLLLTVCLDPSLQVLLFGDP